MHAKNHESLIRWSAQFGAEAPEHTLRFLAMIYECRRDPALEDIRRRVLWDALVGSVEYVAAYESNSARHNYLQLDDVQLIAPGSVRLSIHKKPEDSEQFTVQIGASVHRTPWHGSAFIREGSRRKGYVLESRLALELKYEGAVPVFLDGTLQDLDTSEQSRLPLDGEDLRQAERDKTWSVTRANGQPFFWLERALAEKLIERGLNGPALLDELITQGITRS